MSRTPFLMLALGAMFASALDAQRTTDADASCPPEARAYYQAGLASLRADDATRARAELAEAIARCPGISPYHAAFGRAIITQARDAPVLRKPGLAKRARAEWELAVRLDSTDVIARADLVTWFLTAPGIMGGSARRAMELAEEIRRLDPVRGAIAAARVHRRSGRHDDARRELAFALAAEPANEAAVALLQQLDGTP